MSGKRRGRAARGNGKLYYYKGAGKFLVLFIIFLVLQEVLALYFPMMLKDVSNLINGEGTSSGDIIVSGLVVFAVVCAIFVVNYFSEYFGAVATNRYQNRLRAELFERVQNLPTEQLYELGSGKILPLIMNDTNWIREMEKNLLYLCVFFPIAILGSMVMLFTLDVYYALFALASIPIVVVFFVINSRKLDSIITRSVTAFDDVNTHVKESVVNAKEIRIFNKAKQREKEFARLQLTQRAQSTGSQRAINLSESFNAVLFTFITACIIIYGALTKHDIGMLVVLNASVMYTKKIWDGSHSLIKLFVEYTPRVALARRRLGMIYDLPAEKVAGGIEAEPAGQRKSLEFAHVNYMYPNDVPGLVDVSFKIEGNSRVAIVGGIGSGRTVLSNILLHYIRPSSGKVLFTGFEIDQINPRYFRRNIMSFCAQTQQFIPGSVRENLKLLCPSISDEEILGLFHDIGADAFVEKFNTGAEACGEAEKPFGHDFLNYQIGERDTFNAPTKALLNLARSLLKPASIYVFDQCFNHLRVEYVRKIMAKLSREKKMCIFITQSKWVCKLATRIYVMKDGKVVGQGTHDELVKKSAEYRKIMTTSGSEIINEETVEVSIEDDNNQTV